MEHQMGWTVLVILVPPESSPEAGMVLGKHWEGGRKLDLDIQGASRTETAA